MPHLNEAEAVELFGKQLPGLLEETPESEPDVLGVFFGTFARKEEVGTVLHELREFRYETYQRFEQVDQRFEQVDQRLGSLEKRVDSLEHRMEAGFQELHRAIDRLGARWGIRNESLFRQTIVALLEGSFGAQVESQTIAGEQFDVVIFDHQHILVEIAASAGPDIAERLERKRRLYTQVTGITPARVLLATASIHSRRAQQLRAAGFEVIEPEE